MPRQEIKPSTGGSYAVWCQLGEGGVIRVGAASQNELIGTWKRVLASGYKVVDITQSLELDIKIVEPQRIKPIMYVVAYDKDGNAIRFAPDRVGASLDEKILGWLAEGLTIKRGVSADSESINHLK